MTLEEKLEYFSKQIKEKIDGEYDAKLSKMKEDNDLKLSSKKLELERMREKQIQEFNESNDIRVKKTISLKKQDANRQISDLKKEMFNAVLNEVTNKLTDFMKSDSYPKYLKDLFTSTESSLSEGNYEVYALGKDADVIKKIIDENKKENFTFNLIESEENILGGMIFKSLEKGFVIDNSLRFKLDNIDNDIQASITKKLEVGNGQ